MTITITAFETSPDGGRGLARDMQVRWALEEVGQPYDVQLVSFAALKAAEHCALQPFGQIPTYQEGSLTLFESGAIVLHIAQTHAGLLPSDADARARAVAWMFAAQSTIEPPIIERSTAIREDAQKPWHAERLPLLEARAHARLSSLEARLGKGEWLDGDFSAGDLMMVAVLRRAAIGGLLKAHPTLAAYVARAETRPAFQRAFAAQRAVFERSQAAGS